MSGIKYTYPMTNTWRKSNYIEDQKIEKDNKVKKTSTNEASNQMITNLRKRKIPTERYYDKI